MLARVSCLGLGQWHKIESKSVYVLYNIVNIFVKFNFTLCQFQQYTLRAKNHVGP